MGFLLGCALVELPVAAGDADAADALAAGQDRAPPSIAVQRSGSGGEREAERVRDIERLADRAFRRCWPLVGRGAHRLGRRRVHGVELAALHALEHSRCPPASTTATVTAMPASLARATAVSSTFRAPLP